MTTRNLQAKLNNILADGIEDVKALGIELYDIIPNVRITDNSRRLGSAQDMNRAFVKFAGKKQVAPGKTPLFRISIARRECETDEDIKNVIYHEILHCAPNCQDHQATWKRHAAAVNQAYGLNITTTKKEACEKAAEPVRVKDVREYVGECFKNGNKVYKFCGFNSRPKNNCDIVDIATGKKYVCAAAYVAEKMATSKCLFGASVTAKAPEAPKANADVDYRNLVGKKVKNGKRGRKVFTVMSIDPNGGTHAVILNDEDGVEYYGKIGAAARLVVIS